jgi:membrane carboxypeptidase/penicillin-binding protein
MKNWAKENKKPDGSDWDIYSDGLKIYTTIDSKIQEHAEEAVSAHMKNLQQEFFSQQKDNKNAPFVNITDAETKTIMDKAMKSSERWRVMKDLEKKVNPKSLQEGISQLNTALKMNDPSILLGPMQEGAKEFEAKVGRHMTYSEMRSMWG